MSWDIYGNPLRRGYCEVHAWVQEEYPCSLCRSEIDLQEIRKREAEKCGECDKYLKIIKKADEIIKWQSLLIDTIDDIDEQDFETLSELKEEWEAVKS